MELERLPSPEMTLPSEQRTDSHWLKPAVDPSASEAEAGSGDITLSPPLLRDPSDSRLSHVPLRAAPWKLCRLDPLKAAAAEDGGAQQTL